MKHLSRLVLGLYLFVLSWLVLFKLSFEPISVIMHYQSRSINVLPFIIPKGGSLSEMISNLIVFIPFGLMLSVTLKKVTFRQKLAIVFGFSLITETIQFALAIGTTDITDVIMNTLGGYIGLVAYDASNKYADDKKFDGLITIVGIFFFIIVMLLRTLVLNVRY